MSVEDKYPVVIVEWLDAWHVGSKYMTPKEAQNNTPMLLVDVGFLLVENETGVTLATCGDAEDVDENSEFRHVGFIPKGMIQKITVLKK